VNPVEASGAPLPLVQVLSAPHPDTSGKPERALKRTYNRVPVCAVCTVCTGARGYIPSVLSILPRVGTSNQVPAAFFKIYTLIPSLNATMPPAHTIPLYLNAIPSRLNALVPCSSLCSGPIVLHYPQHAPGPRSVTLTLAAPCCCIPPPLEPQDVKWRRNC